MVYSDFFLTLEPLKLYALNVTRLVWLTRSPLNRVATNRVNLTWLPVGFLIFLYCFRVPVIGGFASVGIPCHCLCIRPYTCFSVIAYFSLSLVYNFVLAKLINKINKNKIIFSCEDIFLMWGLLTECEICTRKYLPEVFIQTERRRSEVCTKKQKANTFPYKPSKRG